MVKFIGVVYDALNYDRSKNLLRALIRPYFD